MSRKRSNNDTSLLNRLKALFSGSYGSPKMSVEETTTFARQMATMIQAGIPLLNALNHIASGSEGGTQKIAKALVRDIARGKPLSSAMSEYPETFSPMALGLIETAEQSGQLAKSFNRWASISERNFSTMKKFKSALVYPAFLLISAVVCIFFFTIWIVPMMEPLLADLGEELPFPTQMLIWFKNSIPYLMGLSIILIIGLWVAWPNIQKYIKEHRSVKNTIDSIPLYFPGIGPTINKMISASILEAFSGLLESGFPATQALSKAARTTSNSVYRDRIDGACLMISEGSSISEALDVSKVFPRAACQMISIGEEGGGLTTILSRVAYYFDQEVEWSLASLSNIIEPIIMAVLGVGVGFIVLASMLPTIQLLNKL